MDYNVKLELAKEYLRSRKKLVSEQVNGDLNRFIPTPAVETDVNRTMNEYRISTRKNKETGSSTVRFFDKKLSYKK
jgi:hypothetical protein